MPNKNNTPQHLVIPQGMNQIQPEQAHNIQGGKRREGAFLDRAIYGLLLGMIVPGGFVIAFF